jgi:hypothetical protein
LTFSARKAFYADAILFHLRRRFIILRHSAFADAIFLRLIDSPPLLPSAFSRRFHSVIIDAFHFQIAITLIAFRRRHY